MLFIAMIYICFVFYSRDKVRVFLNEILPRYVRKLQLVVRAILKDPGADSGGEGKSKPAGKYGTKKSK